MPFHILLVEDNPADVALLREALRESKVAYTLENVDDGEKALHTILKMSRTQRFPDLIILDVNLPRLSGHEVLQAIKGNEITRTVPVIVMSSSQAERDIQRAYEFHANCYVQKPQSLDDLLRIVTSIESFWLNIVQLPPHLRASSSTA